MHREARPVGLRWSRNATLRELRPSTAPIEPHVCHAWARIRCIEDYLRLQIIHSQRLAEPNINSSPERGTSVIRRALGTTRILPLSINSPALLSVEIQHSAVAE